jgi:hypothetical protein
MLLVDGQNNTKSFRIALAMEEEEEWKPFRNALDKSDRKNFDEMFIIPRFYISARSYSVQYVRLHHFKWQTECIKEVEQIESKVEGLQQTIEEDVELLSLPPPTRTAKVIIILKFLVKAKNEKEISKREGRTYNNCMDAATAN